MHACSRKNILLSQWPICLLKYQFPDYVRTHLHPCLMFPFKETVHELVWVFSPFFLWYHSATNDIQYRCLITQTQRRAGCNITSSVVISACDQFIDWSLKGILSVYYTSVLWQKEAILESDISRKWAKCVCHACTLTSMQYHYVLT